MATDVPGILIVDDNEDNRYTLQLMLESDGHERIASAASGNEAIALIEKEKFSLVLLDLMMPDLNGDEVLKVIKSDPDKRDIPVVMISADTDAEKVSQCIELGADDYLPKPFNPTILRARQARSAPAALVIARRGASMEETCPPFLLRHFAAGEPKLSPVWRCRLGSLSRSRPASCIDR